MPQKLGGTACRHNAPDWTNKQASSPHVWDRYEAEERTLPPLKKQTSNFVLAEQKHSFQHSTKQAGNTCLQQ